MSFASSLYSKVTGDSSVAALVGTKVYPVKVPQSAEAPLIVWQEVSSTPDTTLGEASTSGKRLVQFSCLASTYEGAIALGSAVVAALDNATLSNGATCISCTEDDGFSDDENQFIRLVEATFFSAPA